MTEENKTIFGDLNDLIVDTPTDGDCFLMVSDSGGEWTSNITVGELTAGNVEINTGAGGKFLVDGVDVMDRIAHLEALVEKLTAMTVPALEWNPVKCTMSTQEEMLDEIARQAQEKAEYEFELMEHMNRKEEQEQETVSEAYDRAMGIIE